MPSPFLLWDSPVAYDSALGLLSLLLHGTLSTPDSSIDILWALHIITQSQGYPPVPLDSTPRPTHYGNRRCRVLPARLVIPASLP